MLAGASYKFSPANSILNFSGSPSGVEANVSANDGEWWTVDMYPGSGQILAPGTYPNATRYPFNGSGNGLSVYGDGRGCNTLTGSFTVKEVVFSAVDNSLQHLKATFVQHCEGAAPALTGTLKYESAPVVTPPPGPIHLAASPTAGGANISWTNPTYTPYRYTVIRIEPRHPVAEAPIAGQAVYQGTGTTASVTGLTAGVTYTVTGFTVDEFGNVSLPVNTTVTG